MDTAQTIERIKTKVASNGINLGAPLPEKSIAEFERELAIVLPNGYRQFLLHIGNGGDGPPHYGMLSLGLNAIDDIPASDILPNIGRPFPFTEYWVWEGEDTVDEARYAQTFHGSLNLGTDGCAMYWLLIVNGSERGQIWNWTDVGIQPLAPARDFLSWYEYWLDGRDDWYADVQCDA